MGKGAIGNLHTAVRDWANESSGVYIARDDSTGRYVIANGCGGAVYEVREGVVRMELSTGVVVPEERMLEAEAVKRHLARWKFNIMNYGVNPKGEVTMYYDRDLETSPETLDDMFCRLESSRERSCEALTKVVEGEDPCEAVGAPRKGGRQPGLSDLMEMMRDI